MVFGFINPLLYSILIGCSWSFLFKKRFSDSLAPAYMTQIILVLVCGLLFRRLSLGLIAGIIIASVMILAALVRRKEAINKAYIEKQIKKLWNEGLFVFIVLYIFCYIINYKKQFLYWDEFSHWGMFLKESYRLDSLYCMSPVNFAHKDYVPAATVFEFVWCKISGRYSEADAYRSIQMLMFSMLMPMLNRMNAGLRKLSDYAFLLSSLLIIVLVPLLFVTDNSFCFYHSIYCDVVVGILLFYCVFHSYIDYDSFIYQILVITIGLTVFVLTKMTSIALIPVVLLLLLVNAFAFKTQRITIKNCSAVVVSVALPVLFWLWFNKFVDSYVVNTGNAQSYDGMKLSSIVDVFFRPQTSSIPYLEDVKEAFVKAIIHRDILIHGSYVVSTLFVAVMFIILYRLISNNTEKRKLIVACIWTIGSSVYYAMLMFFLYATAFGEGEARGLASYERYMESFVIALVFFLLAVYFDSRIWNRNIKRYYTLLITIVIYLSFFNVVAFDQLLPGGLTYDSKTVKAWTACASSINSLTSETSSVYIIKRGDNGNVIWKEQYYCSPRLIEGDSIGPAIDSNDTHSIDISDEELISLLSAYDYVYFFHLDEGFISSYSDDFNDPSLLVDGSLYRISVIDNRIELESP